MLELAPASRAARRRRCAWPASSSAAGRAARPRRAAHRLRAAGARSRHQRGGDPAAHPARRRGGGAGRRGLLRRARPPYGPRGAARSPRRAATSTPGSREIERGGLDAIVITASGCGTTIKDYGFMLRLDPAYAEKAARVSALAKDITEYLATLDLPRAEREARPDRRLSLRLLDAARPEDHAPAEGAAEKRRLRGAGAARGASVLRLGRHLQHPAAGDFGDGCATARSGTSRRPAPTSIATGNIGCITQIASAARHAGRAHGRAARLGLWRKAAGGDR